MELLQAIGQADEYCDLLAAIGSSQTGSLKKTGRKRWPAQSARPESL
jgi:hypothetical protein